MATDGAGGPSAEYVRESMRKSWGARVQAYVDEAASNTAAHTRVLLQILPPPAGGRVLDVATGPGVVAVAAAQAVGPAGEVVATDLAPEWEAEVARRAREADVGNVSFRAVGAEALDLPDDWFDVAYCQFGLMFVPDPVQALREMRRVLKPEGRAGVVVWSSAPERVPCFSIINRHLNPLIPPEAPDRQLPTPLSLGEPGLIERHVAAAGFRDVRSERHSLDFVSNGLDEMWTLRVEQGPPAVRAAVAALSAAERDRLRQAITADLAPYVRDGKLRLPGEAIYVTAQK
jgi:SAM-dependent methyltransferase